MSSTETPSNRNGTGKKTRGKYTVKACEECRRRRAKCDGGKPSCSRCRQWSISCRYSATEDGRRPAPKSYVLLLRERIAWLERLLEQHGIDHSTGHGTGFNDKHMSMSSEVDDLCESFKGELTLNGSLNFDQDGEMRYFGPTSGRLQFSDYCSPEQVTEPAIHSSDPEPVLNGINIDEYLDPTILDSVIDEFGIPKPLENRLIDLYFTWEQPWYPVVDEVLFREGLSSRGRYWSPLLHNSILAMGSRFCRECLDVRTDPDDPNTAGKPFLEQARELLYAEMEHPSLTTIQALGNIGMFYFAMGADAAGWLHHGMANRLCLDMGLNMDPARLEKTITMSAREIRLRRQIYWTLYFHDKLCASYTGRICSMLDAQAAVNIPSESDEIQDTTTVNTRTPISIRKALIPLQKAMFTISTIQEKILLSLWSPQTLLKDQRPSFLKTCLLELKTWFYDLPHELRIDYPNDVPHVYTLHMVYHTARILLAKPFLTNHISLKSSITVLAQSVCKDSANAICLIAQKYQHAFAHGFQLSPITATHCTLSAATVLLGEPDCTSNRNRLGVCLAVFEELGGSWCPARFIGGNLRRVCSTRLWGESETRDRDKSLGGHDFDNPTELEFGSEELAGVEPETHAQADVQALINPNDTLFQWDELTDDYAFFHILNQSNNTNW